MKDDYSLLDRVRQGLMKCGIESNLVKDCGYWILDCIHCNVLVDDSLPIKFFVCDDDYSAFYTTRSLDSVVCETVRFISTEEINHE